MKTKARVRIGAAYSNPHFEERLSDGSYRWRHSQHRSDDSSNERWQAVLAPAVSPRTSIRWAHALEAAAWLAMFCVGVWALRAYL